MTSKVLLAYEGWRCPSLREQRRFQGGKEKFFFRHGIFQVVFIIQHYNSLLKHLISPRGYKDINCE